MDKFSSFLVSTFNASKIAAAPVPEEPELTVLEKRAYISGQVGACRDEDFLAQFEGTPLAPQAIALVEQELAMQSRHLQTRMQRAAMDRQQDCTNEYHESEALGLQKKQLMLEMHKAKTMGVGAPTPPGQAVIGKPDPALQQMQQPPAEAPVEDPAAQKMAALNYVRAKRAGFVASAIEDASELGGAGFVRGAVGEAGDMLRSAGRNPKVLGALGVGGAGLAIHGHNKNKREERSTKALEQIASFAKGASLATMIQPAAKMTTQELGSALRLQTKARGAQQVASALGHRPAPAGANPFGLARPQVAAPPAWLTQKAAALALVRKMKSN